MIKLKKLKIKKKILIKRTHCKSLKIHFKSYTSIWKNKYIYRKVDKIFRWRATRGYMKYIMEMGRSYK